MLKPNIIEVIHFQEMPSPRIVMEYCPYGSLQACKNVKPEEYVSASRQMLIGLRHLHNNGVAHRDLKPDNLLVAGCKPFRIKISDFGMSKVVGNDFLKTPCGTPRYIAPEVYGSGYLPSVDIWSAGVIMMEFIFGLPTYNVRHHHITSHIRGWTDALVREVDERDENGDQVIIELVRHMVKRSPEDRFTAEACLEKGCEIGLFKRRNDGQIVDIDEDDATVANTEIASPLGNRSDNSDLGSATTPQPPRRADDGVASSWSLTIGLEGNSGESFGLFHPKRWLQ